MFCRRFAQAWLIALAFGLACLSCSRNKGISFKQANTPENLKAFFELIHQTIHVQKDARQAAALFRSLIPDEGRLKKSLREDVAPEVLRRIMEQQNEMDVREANVADLVLPEQKLVAVHPATTEQIADNPDDPVVFMEFPGGAKQLAERVLRPGMTFYEVEFLEPGKDSGMKYHLLYWDGKHWSMLGPMWRVLR